MGYKIHRFTCCICHKEVEEFGNDPWPVNIDDNAECCDACDMSVVVTARLNDLKRSTK